MCRNAGPPLRPRRECHRQHVALLAAQATSGLRGRRFCKTNLETRGGIVLRPRSMVGAAAPQAEPLPHKIHMTHFVRCAFAGVYIRDVKDRTVWLNASPPGRWLAAGRQRVRLCRLFYVLRTRASRPTRLIWLSRHPPQTRSRPGCLRRACASARQRGIVRLPPSGIRGGCRGRRK